MAVEEIEVDAQNSGRLNPENYRRYSKRIRDFDCPRHVHGVDESCHRTACGGTGGYDFGQGFGTAGFELGQEPFGVAAAKFEAVVVAVGEGAQGQAIGGGAGFGHAAVGEDAAQNGDFDAHFGKVYGELERGVDGALRRKRQVEDVRVHRDWLMTARRDDYGYWVRCSEH